MKKSIYHNILKKLLSITPLFGEELLKRSISKINKTPETLMAVDLLNIIRNDIQPSLSISGSYTNSILNQGAGFLISDFEKILYRDSGVLKIVKQMGFDFENDTEMYQRLQENNIIVPKQFLTKILINEYQMPSSEMVYCVINVPIFDEQKRIYKSALIFQDITLSRQLEEEAISQQKEIEKASTLSALGEMAGGIAHEINNPLAIIDGFAQKIRYLSGRNMLSHEEAIDASHNIENMVKRITAIVKGLRNFSRDASGDPMDLYPLKSVIHDTLAFCGEKIKSQGVILYLDSVPDELVIECQLVQVSQVLLNLINNAFDAVKDLNDKWIKITVSQTDEFVEIAVLDSGMGVHLDIREKIMDPFFTTKDIGKGTGLGLSVSLSIMKRHGGDLILDNKSENTKFIMRFRKK